MKKHVLDRPKHLSNALLPRAVAIMRRKKPNTASLMLQRRGRAVPVKGRVQQFLRIDHQQTS